MSHVSTSRCAPINQGDKPRIDGVEVVVFVPAPIARQLLSEYASREGMSARLLAESARLLAEPLAEALNSAKASGKLPFRD